MQAWKSQKWPFSTYIRKANPPKGAVGVAFGRDLAGDAATVDPRHADKVVVRDNQHLIRSTIVSSRRGIRP